MTAMARDDRKDQRGRPRLGARLAVALAALLAGAGLFLAPTPRAVAKGVPPGMVPYDKPVYRNGRRVLYHGAWRGRGKGAKAPAKAGKSGAPPAAESGKAAGVAESPARGAEPAGMAGQPVPAAVAPAAAAPRARLTLAMEPRLGGELVKAMAARGIDLDRRDNGPADLVVTPVPLGLSRLPGTVEARAVARLFDCEIVAVGGGAMSRLADLSGRRVAVESADSLAGRAARRLFSAAGVPANFVEVGPGGGAQAMAEGRAEGYVVASPAPDLADAPAGARLLSIPFEGALREQFLPVELAKSAYPRLIPGERVDALAEPLVLSASDPGVDLEKRAAVDRFVPAFFEALGSGALPDGKWRDVNPAALTPLPRLDAAQAWIDRRGAK